MRSFNENIGISEKTYAILAKYELDAARAHAAFESFVTELINSATTTTEQNAVLDFMSTHTAYALWVTPTALAFKAANKPLGDSSRTTKRTTKSEPALSDAAKALLDALNAASETDAKAAITAYLAARKARKAA